MSALPPPRHAVSAVLLIVCGAVQLAAVLCTPLELSGDEAQYWQWSRRPDLSYYSKGPLVPALVAGSTRLLGDTQAAVRLPALVCWLLFLAFACWFLNRECPPRVARSALLVAATCPIFFQMGALMTTDAPVALCWLLASIALYYLLRGGSARWWVIAGLSLGIGSWAKLTIVLLVPAAVYVAWVVRPPAWKHLLAGGAAFVCCLAPLLIWNIRHGWINVAHNLSHLAPDSPSVRAQYLAELFGGQLALAGLLLLPLGFLASMRVLRRRTDRALVGLALGALPLLAVAVLVSLQRRVYANWPLPAYISLLLVTACYAGLHPEFAAKIRNWVRGGVLLNIAVTGGAIALYLGCTFGLEQRILPSKKLNNGVRAAAKKVERLVALDMMRRGAPPFIVADSYRIASGLSFYVPSHPYVICENVDDRRMTQHDVWQQSYDWSALLGKNAIIVLRNPESVSSLGMRFKSIGPAAEPLIIGSKEDPDAAYYFYWAREYRGGVPAQPRSY